MLNYAEYRSSPDADGCTGSGSIALRATGSTFYQCVSTSNSLPTHYYFAYRYKNWDFNDNQATSGNTWCHMSFITDGSGCSLSNVTESSPDESSQAPAGTWIQGHGEGMTPAGTTSVMITCQAVLGTGFYDQIYLGTSAPPASGF